MEILWSCIPGMASKLFSLSHVLFFQHLTLIYINITMIDEVILNFHQNFIMYPYVKKGNLIEKKT